MNRSGGIGLTLAVLSAASFGTSGTFASALIAAHWSPAAAVLARTALAALLLTVPAVLRLRGQWWLLRRHARSVLAFGLVAVAGCQLCYFSAIARMPVGVALLLEYLGAVLVVCWMRLRHGQRQRRLTIAGATCAIAGLALVLDLSGGSGINPAGLVFGLLSAAGLAVYFVLSAAEDTEPLPPMVMTWASMVVGAGALGLFWLAGGFALRAGRGAVLIAGHRMNWLVPVLGLALLSTVVPYIAGIGAARRLGAKVASFAGMAEVLFAITFAWLLLGQLPSGLQFLGGAGIVAGVTLIRIDELKTPSHASRSPAPPGQPPQSRAALGTAAAASARPPRGLLPGTAVEAFPDQVGVPVVPGILLDHVPEHIPQREHLVTVCTAYVE